MSLGDALTLCALCFMLGYAAAMIVETRRELRRLEKNKNALDPK